MNRLCAYRGLLVDGSARLPTDPCDYWSEATLALAGCNRLKCSSCGAMVRAGALRIALKEGAVADAAALYASESWLELPFVERREKGSSLDKGSRLYACKCRYWEAESAARLENDHDSPSDPDLPWSCAGHETPKLPLELDGLTVGGDWKGLVAKILAGACPRKLELPRTEGPGLWLGWLYAYLLGVPEAESLSEALSERVSDADPAVVGSVLWFFARFPKARGIDNVIAHGEAHLHEVAVGQLIPDHYVPTMWDVIVARLETHLGEPVDARAAAVAQTVMVTPLASLPHQDVGRQEWIHPLYKSLRKDVVDDALDSNNGTFDTEELRIFLADHIVEIDAAAPGRWKKVMSRLSDWALKPDTGHLILIAGTRVLQSGIASPDALEEWIEWRRVNHGWMEDAWVLPLKDTIEQHKRQLTAN